MLLPLSDESPMQRFPVATVAIILANVATWVLVQGLGNDHAVAESLCLYGLIPADLLGTADIGSAFPLGDNLQCVVDGSVPYQSLLTSMFLHAGWLHLIGNMWFLWIFGDNVEDAMGPGRYLAFYLLSGLAAAAAQVLSEPGSMAPMIGASGAIGGVLGAYIRLYPGNRIKCLIVLIVFFTTVSIPAIYVLGLWFAMQVLSSLPVAAHDSGVAVWAHIGGFLAGLALIGPMHKPELLRRHRAALPRRHARHRW